MKRIQKILVVVFIFIGGFTYGVQADALTPPIYTVGLDQQFIIEINQSVQLANQNNFNISLMGISEVCTPSVPNHDTEILIRECFPRGVEIRVDNDGEVSSHGLWIDQSVFVGGFSIFLKSVTSETATFLIVDDSAHSAGTNIIDSGGTMWYITSRGCRSAYTSAGTFLSYGFNRWDGVSTVSRGDMFTPVCQHEGMQSQSFGPFIYPQAGKIICADRGIETGTCYLMGVGVKHGFVSESVFTRRGHSFNQASYADLSWVPTGEPILYEQQRNPVGVPINHDGFVKMHGYDEVRLFPNAASLFSYGYSFGDVIAVTIEDRTLFDASRNNNVQGHKTKSQLHPLQSL